MKRKDKKQIKDLAREQYSKGKSMQETFDLISTKVKKPITEIADVIRFYPSPSLYEKHKKNIFLLFYSIMATELLILVAAISVSFYSFNKLSMLGDIFGFPSGIIGAYVVFFHKGYIFVLVAFSTVLGEAGSFGSFDSGAAVFGSIVLLILGIVLIILPIVVWLLAISNIIKGHFKKDLEYIKMIIPYYWYTLIFYSIASFIISYGYIMDYIYSSYNRTSGFVVFLIVFGLIVALLLPYFFILRLAIKVRKNVTPEYKKVRLANTGSSSKRKTRLGIVFNDK